MNAKLEKILNDPNIDEGVKDAFIIVDAITNEDFDEELLTSDKIKEWDKKFDDALKQLLDEGV